MEKREHGKYLLTHMWNLENGTGEPICRAGIEPERWGMDLWSHQEGEGGTSQRLGMTYITTSKK